MSVITKGAKALPRHSVQFIKKASIDAINKTINNPTDENDNDVDIDE